MICFRCLCHGLRTGIIVLQSAAVQTRLPTKDQGVRPAGGCRAGCPQVYTARQRPRRHGRSLSSALFRPVPPLQSEFGLLLKPKLLWWGASSLPLQSGISDCKKVIFRSTLAQRFLVWYFLKFFGLSSDHLKKGHSRKISHEPA